MIRFLVAILFISSMGVKAQVSDTAMLNKPGSEQKDDCSKGNTDAWLDASHSEFQLIYNDIPPFSIYHQKVLTDVYKVHLISYSKLSVLYCNCYNETMTRKILEKYGPSFWGDVAARAAKYVNPPTNSIFVDGY